MSSYTTVATVTSLSDLKNITSTYHLQSGDRVKLRFEVGSAFAYLFDLAGAEQAFSPLMPTSMNLVDVWGEGEYGYVEMEATSPWLSAVLAFIAENWLSITIAGFVIAALAITITVAVKISTAASSSLPVALLVAGAMVVVWILYNNRRKT